LSPFIRLILLSILVLPVSVLAKQAEPFEHDYISCSMVTVEQLTILQLAQRGLTEQQALKELPFNHRAAKQRVSNIYALLNKEGILNTYSLINSNYARCAKLVHEAQGIPAKDLKGYAYYFCAGENKTRYEIILRINQSFNLDLVLEQVPDTHFDVAINYFNLINNKGILASFDYTANNLKACLNQIK